jgi:alpha-tubulin suppressor-like RCC1 family protein
VTKDRKLVGWGSNEFGTLAVGSTNETIYKPTEMTKLPFAHHEAIQVSFGTHHTMMLTKDRFVFS